MLSTKVRENLNGKMRFMCLLALFGVPLLFFVLGATAPNGWARDDPPVCWFNIEFNASDQDVGVRGFFDYEPWRNLKIINPDNKTIAKVKSRKSMRDQGFAEWFYESGEPTLEDLSFAEFFERFPEGLYNFQVKTIKKDKLDCMELFTHVIPCAPEISADFDSPDFVVSWDPVDSVVDPNNTPNTEDEVECVSPESLGQELEVYGYEVIVETEVDDVEKIFKVDLPADVNEVTVPPEFLELGEEFQYEVLVIEIDGNQTITEDEFCLNEEGDEVVDCPEDED
jgi:hypothetical protein